MTEKKPPIAIKKYANRRLYHTGTSTYVTLDDLAGMVKRGEDFLVTDAKSGEDITRSVLAQIIFDQEGKSGQNLLPITFLRQLISYYGDSMQALVPSYLEYSIKTLTDNQQKFRDQIATTFSPFGMMEDQVHKNMSMFRESLAMFTPFGLAGHDSEKQDNKATENADKPNEAPKEGEDLDALKRELSEIQKRLDKMTGR